MSRKFHIAGSNSHHWTKDGQRFMDKMITWLTPLFKDLSRRNAMKLARRLIDEAHHRYRSDRSTPDLGCREHECFSCCLFNHEIEATDFETIRILNKVENDGRLQDVVIRAERLIQGGRGGVCPLLSIEGKCTVYKDRPLSCAAMHSMDREMCKLEGGQSFHAERLWIETHYVAGFGMYGSDRIHAGGIEVQDLYHLLADLGRERLEKREAA